MIRLMLACPLLLAGASPAQEVAGVVSGIVRFEGTHKPRRLNEQINKDKHGGPHLDGRDLIDETVVVGSKGELANVLIRLKNPPHKKFAAAAEPVTLSASDYQFSPRVYVLRPEQTLIMKNTGFDRFNFNVRTERNSTDNMGILRGAHRETSFKLTEIGIKVSHICCPWQVAWVHVLDHPFFAVTGPDGKFEIKGLPPGEYEIEAWHETFGTKTATVKVGAKETKTQDFTFDKK